MRKRHFIFGMLAALCALMHSSAALAQEGGPSLGEVINTLNRLIGTAKDGAQGYQTAAGDVQDSELREKFRRISEERGRFAGQLIRHVRELGAEPRTQGSLGAAFHRGWINFKSGITGKDDKSIISEIETGENVAVEAYEEALQKDLPGKTRQIVERQAASVKEDYQELQNLENQLHYEESVEKHKEDSHGMERGAAGAVDSKAAASSGTASEITFPQIAS